MLYDWNDADIENIINKYLVVRGEEKDKYGEVFTPRELIDKMLDLLPLGVFEDPHLKWLEPSAGIGNFMMIVYLRLMKGLATWEPDQEKRSKHIVENMLFMVELNERNVEIIKDIFGSSVHVIHGDFLQENYDCDFLFDVIVGNLPFQDVKNRGGKNKLYERILSKCLSLLIWGGFLTFITPDNLFGGGSKVYGELILNHMVSTISFDKSIQTFFPKIQQYMCFFLVEKGKGPKKKTQIIGNQGESFNIILTNRPVNPFRNWTEQTEALIHEYIYSKRNQFVYNRGKPLHCYNEDVTKEKYTLIYTPSKKIYTSCKNLALGIGIKKIVLFLISPNLEFEIDREGKYGVGPNTFYLPIDNIDDVVSIEAFFKSDIYRTMALATKTTRQFLKMKFIEHLDIDKIIKTNPI